MNKEQLRKELEDCWDACEGYLSMPFNAPDRDQYITTRLAALDDVDDYVEQLKELLRFDNCPEILIEYPGLIKGQPATPESIAWAEACIERYEKKRVDDGQEGKGQGEKGMKEALEALYKFQPSANHGYDIVRIRQIALEGLLKNQYQFALPLPDGEGEKVGLKEALEEIYKLKPSANHGWDIVRIREIALKAFLKEKYQFPSKGPQGKE